MVLKLVLFDNTLIYVQSDTASLDETPAIVKKEMEQLSNKLKMTIYQIKEQRIVDQERGGRNNTGNTKIRFK